MANGSAVAFNVLSLGIYKEKDETGTKDRLKGPWSPEKAELGITATPDLTYSAAKPNATMKDNPPRKLSANCAMCNPFYPSVP